MARVMINKYFDDDVTSSGQDVQSWDVIPDGETWHLDRMGACSIGSSAVALQAKISGSWKTIRMFACGTPGGHGEFEVNQDFVGDGALQLRLVRKELSGSTQQIVCWVEGYKVVA